MSWGFLHPRNQPRTILTGPLASSPIRKSTPRRHRRRNRCLIIVVRLQSVVSLCTAGNNSLTSSSQLVYNQHNSIIFSLSDRNQIYVFLLYAQLVCVPYRINTLTYLLHYNVYNIVSSLLCYAQNGVRV